MHVRGFCWVIFDPHANTSFVWNNKGPNTPHGMSGTLISFNIVLQKEMDCEQNKFITQQQKVHFHFV